MSTTTTPTHHIPRERDEHTSPKNQIHSNNHCDHRHVNQLIPGSSSTNNSRTTPVQAETSTIVIPKTAIG